MPKTQSLSALLKGKLDEHTLLTDPVKINSSINEIGEIIDLQFEKLSLDDLWITSKNIPSLFWLIVSQRGFEPLFLKLWQRFGQQIPLEALLAAPHEGPNKGKSLLWYLSAAGKNKSEAFLAVWQRFNQQIPLEALLVAPHEGPSKGKSALWWLSFAAASNGNPEAFLAVWQRFSLQIPLEALLAAPHEGSNKGITMLWFLSAGACDNYPEAFLAVWQRFSLQIPLEALLVAPHEEGPNKGKSALWCLSAAAGNSKPETFLRVWQRFNQQIPLEALLAAPHEGSNKGITMLWFLSAAASNGNPEAFLAVWQRFSLQIPLEALLVAPHEGLSKGISALWMLNRSNFNPEWWKLLLQQKPGIITDAQLNFTKNNLPSLKSTFEKLGLMPLVNARNHFFSLLKNESLPSEEKIKLLLEEAKKATDVGYCNAFYDLSCFLRSNSQHEMAFDVLKQVPNISCYYPHIMIELSEGEFALALAAFDNPAKRMRHLETSLQYALQTDDDNRPMLIQRIASIYIEGKKEVGDSDLVSKDWLAAMNSGTTVEWCVNRFLEIKKQKDLEKELKEQKEALHEERAVKKHLLARMETLEQENQALKKQKADVQPDQISAIETNTTPTLLFGRKNLK